MQVQINMNKPFEFKAGQELSHFGYTGELVSAIDPGKTNMAMVVGTTFGTQLCIIQFRAPGSGYDTSDYCRDFKDFISRYFKDCTFKLFGIEQAISKKGMVHHHSSMVLTEIRANLIDLAYNLTGHKAVEINNWSWKYAILPDGMRSQSEKGSARFLPEVYSTYGNADVTDGICMYRYLIQEYCLPAPVIIPNKAEAPLAPYSLHILPKGAVGAKDSRRFNYETHLSLQENCAYFINRTWERGVALVSLDCLSLEEIYKYARGFIVSNSSETVEVVVVRS